MAKGEAHPQLLLHIQERHIAVGYIHFPMPYHGHYLLLQLSGMP